MRRRFFYLLCGVALAALLTGASSCGFFKPGAGKNDYRERLVTPRLILTISDVALRRREDFYVCELVLEVSSLSKQELELSTPLVSLVAGPGEALPRYFQAFDHPPVLPPGKAAQFSLKYRLSNAHLAGELWLDVDGQRKMVKSAGSGSALPELGEEWVRFSSVHWGTQPVD